MKQDVLKVHNILDKACPEDISFLEKRDSFQFLVSVILSAQTTDERVNQVTPALFAKYPDATSLANADLETVKQIIRPTGFYNAKAEHIVNCAKDIVDKFDGKVPESMEELLTLSGVGRKTANCLRANVLGKPGIVVDTHFSRVVNRIFGLGTRDPETVERFVAANLDESLWNRFSMTANLHGRTTCHSRKPDCKSCPVMHICEENNKC